MKTKTTSTETEEKAIKDFVNKKISFKEMLEKLRKAANDERKL